MNAQIITTPSGERMVLLAEKDYEALLSAAEDAADIEAVREFRRRMAAGEEELVPSEVVDRLLAGDNPIRVWREHRGLSAKALAEESGIAPAFLSQIETGKREGAVETLKKIAAALRVKVDDLI
jgi:DNA-binding Xre family transcriptional regulator